MENLTEEEILKRMHGNLTYFATCQKLADLIDNEKANDEVIHDWAYGRESTSDPLTELCSQLLVLKKIV